MTGISDIVQPVAAAAVLGLLAARPRMLALGEPTHGEDVLLDVRNDLFCQLVEQEGYRTVALESDCLMGLLVDDYVTTGAGSLDEVMARGFSHGWGASAANRALVAWMRAYNEGRPAPEQVRFAGADGPLEIAVAASPRQALIALHRHLAARLDALPCTEQALDGLLGPDERWTDPAVIYHPDRSVGRTADAERLREVTDALVALLDAQTPDLTTASSRDAWDRARLYGRTAVGLLRYHHGMADPSPERLSRLAAQRGVMIAENLLALAERGPVLAHAHNLHLKREPSAMRMGDLPLAWRSTGAIVSEHLGGQYAFLATALGTIRHQGVDVPPADTVEGMLYALAQDRLLVDARRLAALLADAKPEARVSGWFGYFPLDPAHLADVDGIVFVKDCPGG